MKKYYWIIYTAIIALIVVSLIVFQNISDMGQMLLFATAIIITSIFTYSTRRKK